MKKPKRISVIIPTYNRQNIVINTLEHFCKQASSGFEVIIVDQTNKFEGKLNNFKSQNFDYRYLTIDEIGLPNARNIGANEAQGEILIFIDDDSIPDESLVANYRELFQSLGSAVLIGGRVIEKDSSIFKEGKIRYSSNKLGSRKSE